MFTVVLLRRAKCIFLDHCFACEDHLRDFSFVHGPCLGEDRVLETFFSNPRIANEPLHSVAVVLTIQFRKDW